MTDKPHRLSLKLDPGTNWIEINWWTVNVWHFERHCLQLNGCRQGSLIGAFQYLVCHENRQNSCYIVQEDTDWGRYWLNSRTRPMILFSTLVRSPTVRSGISLLLFHCDHWHFRSVQVTQSEEPHAKYWWRIPRTQRRWGTCGWPDIQVWSDIFYPHTLENVAATPGCNSHCGGHGLNPHQHYNHPNQDHIDIGHCCHDDQNYNINILNISVQQGSHTCAVTHPGER